MDFETRDPKEDEEPMRGRVLVDMQQQQQKKKRMGEGMQSFGL